MENMERTGATELQPNLIELEASVPTGLEKYAAEEAFEKLQCKVEKAGRGKISIFIPQQDVLKAFDLKGIDHLSVLVKRYPEFQFAATHEEVMAQLRELVFDIDWALGLDVWNMVAKFPHLVDPLPRRDLQLVSSEDTVDSSQTSHVGPGGDAGPHQTTDTTQAAPQEPEPKRPKMAFNPLKPTFRVTCNRTGTGHSFQSMEAAYKFGGSINDHFGWNVKLKEMDLEVELNIEEKHVYVAIALTRKSLHRRNITSFGPTTLRPTIAYGLLRACSLRPGDIVVDPMCGGGSIPIEAALDWPGCVHWCGDIHEKTWSRTSENIEFVNKSRSDIGKKPIDIQQFKWDACRLPLRDGSVDVMVSDMPFGKRSGSQMSNWHLYPSVLREMARVCKPKQGRAALLTHDKKCFKSTYHKLSMYWKRVNIIWINIGGLAAAINVLHRTGVPVSKENDQMTPPETTETHNT